MEYRPNRVVFDKKKLIFDLVHVSKRLQRTATKFGITRERVRQIYLEQTGQPWGKKRDNISRHEKIARENEIIYNCIACNAPVKRKHRSPNSKYCLKCRYISRKLKRDPKITLICRGCGIKFNPLRNWAYVGTKNLPIFHSSPCYIKHQDLAALKGKKRYTDDDLIQDVVDYLYDNLKFPNFDKRYLEIQGRVPGIKASISTYVNRFGSWVKARKVIQKTISQA